MSRDPRKDFYDRNRRDSWDRDIRERRDSRESRDLRDHLRERDLLRSRERDYRSFDKHKRSPDKHRSRSPRKSDKDLLDDNILKEISKLPEPSEMWENQGYPPPPGTVPPPGFAPPEPNYPPNFQSSYSGIYDDFPSMAPIPTTTQAPPAPEWNQLALPPPPEPLPAPATFIPNIEDQMKKEGKCLVMGPRWDQQEQQQMDFKDLLDNQSTMYFKTAIESEMRHQKAALSKQREDYIKKAGVLKKELETLKDQRNELRGDTKRSPSPDTKRFLKENTKLQLEIQNKLKTITNVVDMLNGIIGEEALAAKLEDNDVSDRPSKRKSRSPSTGNKFNYVYYDPEMHWCRVCNEFPSTAKDYLNHLHSPQHSKMAAAHMEAPWHSLTGVNEGFPSFPSAPTKRTPIKGLQFFVPSTAWYCKLCDVFIGDLHCASAHLKSIAHAKNYSNFVDQNPHWETDWMSDRQKAVEKSRTTTTKQVKTEDKSYTAHTITFNKDGFSTKKKDSTPPPEDKKKKEKKKLKKKKRESSSSSDSSSSDSERAKKKKKEKSRKTKEGVISELMSAIKAERFTDQDRKIFESLKTRIKEEKRTPDRAVRDRERSIADMQRKIRESERRESDRREMRDREEREREREPRERREEERRRERSSPPQDKKDKEKKMPFIGKMPVYKTLTKIKVDDLKKDDQKKKEDDEASKKRREEMDAEIQKKVQEFKEKIARAQAEREQQSLLGPPPLALPTALGNALPPPLLAAPPPQPPQPPPPAVVPGLELPKDFQEALNILFPTGEQKKDLGQDMFPGFQQGFNSLLGMPPFPPLGMGGMMPPNMPNMNPNMPPNMNPNMPPQMMMPFNMTPALFQGNQLYDKHVPMQPNNKQRGRNMNYNNKKNNNYNKNQNRKNNQNNQKQKEKEIGERAKEELDDMAMLGIESSDVGAGGKEPASAPAPACETVKGGDAADK